MLKKTTIYAFFILVSITINAQTVNITNSGGWFESAFITWDPVSKAESYNVYLNGEGITNQKIDNQLIRNYGTYFRADVLGLTAGNYTISVAPIISGTESTATASSTIGVKGHDRTGFAFSNNRIPGAYNIDGTPKPGAVILYITENTKNTISLNVTGANENPCIGLQSILDGFKKGNDTRPLIIRMIGQISDFDYMLNGDIVIENKNNSSSFITLEGVGNDAVAYGWGIRIKNASNIEIRNIATMLTDSNEGDNIGLQQDNEYIWIHNVDFFYGDAGSDGDQAKGDGALDCKRSTYVTFSYNHFWDSGKSNLLGLSENTTEGLFITYHHNWYDHSDSRHPRVRFYSAHVYNNYYDGNSKYGVGATEGSSVFVENNYFRHCKYPMLTSMQGSDVYNSTSGTNDYSNNPTFSKEDGGSIKAFNNFISGATRFVPYGDGNYPNPTVDFDAFVTSTRNETIGASVVSAYGGNDYNNFDTNMSIMYSYTPESPNDARTNVMQNSGRMNGGDFSWNFNNAFDDSSYAVNTPLKNALKNYSTNLVSIQGDAIPDPEITLTAHAGDGLVNLNWSYSNFSASTFEIFRDTDTDPTGRISLSVITDVSISHYVDDTVNNDTTYYYWVVANNNVESNIDTATPKEGTVGGGNEIHNFTESGTNSSFYNISGNLSRSKGTVIYNGLTLTQCLKIESATTIEFTTSVDGDLTLVFNETFSGEINIDGVKYNATSGVLTQALASGTHTILKGDVANLYYMSFQSNALDLEKIKTHHLRLYPNPVSSVLYLSTPLQIERIYIYNLLGVLIKSVDKIQNSVDLSGLNAGSYVLKAATQEGTIDKIIIKK